MQIQEILCETIFIIFEYFKMVPFGLILMESVYLLRRITDYQYPHTGVKLLVVSLLFAWGNNKEECQQVGSK